MQFPCRFTDRTITLAAHGSGIKLTIHNDGVEHQRSIFLDQLTTIQLSQALSGLYLPATPAPQPRRDFAAVADALAGLANALRNVEV
jgi:hypothetical protein